MDNTVKYMTHVAITLLHGNGKQNGIEAGEDEFFGILGLNLPLDILVQVSKEKSEERLDVEMGGHRGIRVFASICALLKVDVRDVGPMALAGVKDTKRVVILVAEGIGSEVMFVTDDRASVHAMGALIGHHTSLLLSLSELFFLGSFKGVCGRTLDGGFTGLELECAMGLNSGMSAMVTRRRNTKLCRRKTTCARDAITEGMCLCVPTGVNRSGVQHPIGLALISGASDTQGGGGEHNVKDALPLPQKSQKSGIPSVSGLRPEGGAHSQLHFPPGVKVTLQKSGWFGTIVSEREVSSDDEDEGSRADPSVAEDLVLVFTGQSEPDLPAKPKSKPTTSSSSISSWLSIPSIRRLWGNRAGSRIPELTMTVTGNAGEIVGTPRRGERETSGGGGGRHISDVNLGRRFLGRRKRS